MQDIKTHTNLRETIQQLEIRRDIEQKDLKIQLETTYESLKPANLIRNTFKEVVGSEEIRGNAIHATVGIATGIISRKLFVGFSKSPMRKLLGTLLMFGITNVVSKRPQMLSSIGNKIMQFVGRKKKLPDDNDLSTQIDYTEV